MNGKLKQESGKAFQEPQGQETGSVRWRPIVLWFLATGVVGVLVPFVFPGGNAFIKATLSSILFIAITAKTVSRWSME